MAWSRRNHFESLVAAAMTPDEARSLKDTLIGIVDDAGESTRDRIGAAKLLHETTAYVMKIEKPAEENQPPSKNSEKGGRIDLSTISINRYA